MVREIVAATVLCAGIIAGTVDAGRIEQEAIENYTDTSEAEDEAVIPEYIVTQQMFSSFSDLLPGESQTQVFSVLNMDEVTHTYYLKVEASACMTMEVTKGGDFFTRGAVTEDTMELVTLAPGENKVFSLTLTEPEDGDGCTKVKLYFTKRQCIPDGYRPKLLKRVVVVKKIRYNNECELKNSKFTIGGV